MRPWSPASNAFLAWMSFPAEGSSLALSWRPSMRIRGARYGHYALVSTTTTFICPYCGEPRPRSEGSLEHPLPWAIGGRAFSRRAFDDPCNKRAGREVDRPFVEHEIVRALRHKFGIADRHGNVPPAPRMFGDRGDGARGYLELGQKPRVRRVPRKIRDDETGVSFITDPGEGAEFGEQQIPRLEQRGRELYGEGGFRIEMSVEGTEDEGDVTITSRLKMDLWPRFGAKLGLAFGREALGEKWVGSEDAARLRRLLWAERGAPSANPLWEQVSETDAFALLAPAPQHLIRIGGGFGTGCGLIVQLFGALRYGVPLSDSVSIPEPVVWLFDPVAGTARQTTQAQLIDERTPAQPF
jgi:hypothetical protein